MNTRSTHFSTSNKRFDKSDALRPVKVSSDHISAEALVMNTDVPSQGKKIREATQSCIYCKGNHFNDSCKQYTDVSVSTRKKQLQKQGRCFICLRTGHVSKECSTSFKPCYYCKRVGHHHRSICPTKFKISDESAIKKTFVNLSSADTDQPPQSDEKNSESAIVVSNALLAGGERVLLQTAQVVVCGKDGVQCQARILMDSASHRTFMTEQMAKCLNLPSQRVELLSLSTFGTKRTQHLDTYVVNFNIIVKDGSSLSLHANVLQQITGPIWRDPLHQADVEFFQAIAPERLADDIPVQSNSVAIDILVG